VGQGHDRAVGEIQIVDEEKAKKVCIGAMTGTSTSQLAAYSPTHFG